MEIDSVSYILASNYNILRLWCLVQSTLCHTFCVFHLTRTSFVTSLTRNLEDVRPDDIVLLRQHNSVTEHSGPEDPIIVNINAEILGSSGKVRRLL